MKRKSKVLLILSTALLLVSATACTPSEAQILEGILKEVDSVNGEITIVTKDGRTITLDISDTTVETEGATSDVGALEKGASVEIEVNEGGKVAKRIEAKQAEVEGIISKIEGDQVTVKSEKEGDVTVRVTVDTRIEADDDSQGTSASLEVGNEVEIKYDPESMVAFKIELEDEDKSEDKDKDEEDEDENEDEDEDRN